MEGRGKRKRALLRDKNGSNLKVSIDGGEEGQRKPKDEPIGGSSIHSRRRNPNKFDENRQGRLKFKHAASLEEIHYIVHAPPAYHLSLDGFADETVEETWTPDELTVPELKDALKKRGLKKSGRKADLVERLSEVVEEERRDRRERREVKRRKLDEILVGSAELALEREERGQKDEEEEQVKNDSQAGGDNVLDDVEDNEPNGKMAQEGGEYSIKRVPRKENGCQTPQQPPTTSTTNATPASSGFETFFQEIESTPPKLSNSSSGICSSATPSPSASPKKPLRGVLKKREQKEPKDMKIPELKEHLLAFGISGCSGKKRSELVELLEEAIEDSKHSSIFISF